MSVFYHTKYSNSEINRLLEIGSRHVIKPINKAEIDSIASNGKIANDFASNFDTAMQKLIENRSKIYLFENLDQSDIALIVKNARLLTYGAHETLFGGGDRGKEIFFILSGGADIFVTLNGGRNEKIAQIGGGTLVGETAFINHKPRESTCVSTSADTSAISFEINEEAMGEAAAPFLRLYINITNALAKKIDAAILSA
ncbi:MAG: cyclic nucleotide-binding domain-containing protein [Helicobacteraceae bacterium]|jgi:CRP-like cAMP-binding protein|nr:cyclic nucleotide-binding domain-containing protein [Helicobacteraceae bacterium]